MNESVLYLCMCVLVGVVDVSVGWVLFLGGRGFLSGVGKVLRGLGWVLWCSDGIKQTPWNHYHRESCLIDTKQKKQNLHIPFNSRSIIFLTCLLQFPPPYLQITIYHTGVNKAPTFDLALPLESRVQHRHFPASSLCKSTSNKPPSVSPTFTKRSLSSVYTISLLIYFFLSLTAFFFSFTLKCSFAKSRWPANHSTLEASPTCQSNSYFFFFFFHRVQWTGYQIKRLFNSLRHCSEAPGLKRWHIPLPDRSPHYVPFLSVPLLHYPGSIRVMH